MTVELIDEANPLNNDFAIAEEVTVVEQSEKRPDLVVYLNGIAVAVIELKRSGVSVSEGIRQNLTNQKNSFIQSFLPRYSSAWQETNLKDCAMEHS